MKLAHAPDVLTVDEAARVARVGRNAMYAAVQRGDVWSARIGKSIRIPKSALAAYLGFTREEAPATTPTPPGVDRIAPATAIRRAS